MALWLVLGSAVHVNTMAAPLPDPTRPMDAVAPSGRGPAGDRGPVLQSTMVAPGHKLAIINGKQYGVGDSVAGGRIVDIRPYEVILVRGGLELSWRLFPELEKVKTATHESKKAGHNGKVK